MVKPIFTSYFVQAYMLVYFLAEADKDNLASMGDLVHRGVKRSYAVSIIKELIDKKLVIPKEGRGGGYYLTSSPEYTLRKLFNEDEVRGLMHSLKEILEGNS